MVEIIVQHQFDKAEPEEMVHMLAAIETLSDEESRKLLADESGSSTEHRREK